MTGTGTGTAGTEPAAAATQPRRRSLRAWVRRQGVRLSSRAVEGLYESVRADPEAATAAGAASVTASFLAVLVHLVTILVVVLAAFVLWASPSKLLGTAGAVLLLGAAWLTRPRPDREPPQVRWVESPQLRRLVDEVAVAAGAPVPHRIGFDDQLNATYAVVGWHRERLLVVGLPLWEALPSQQRVALLGHELGHAAAKDSRHRLLVSTALEALEEWMLLCHYDVPGGVASHRGTTATAGSALVQLGEVMARWLLAVVGLVPAAAYGVLLTVTQRESQRAEYGADVAGARIAGRPAMAAALSTLMECDALQLSMRRTAMGAGRGDVLAAVRAEGENLAATGWPNRRNRHRHGPFDSHPPDDLRRALVQTLPELPPVVVLDPARAQRVDDELEAARAWANRRIYDRFQAH